MQEVFQAYIFLKVLFFVQNCKYDNFFQQNKFLQRKIDQMKSPNFKAKSNQSNSFFRKFVRGDVSLMIKLNSFPINAYNQNSGIPRWNLKFPGFQLHTSHLILCPDFSFDSTIHYFNHFRFIRGLASSYTRQKIFKIYIGFFFYKTALARCYNICLDFYLNTR